jgi:cellobiose phosphorylase
MGGEVGKYTVTRKCRGAEYRIHVKNGGGQGGPRLTVDGKPVAGDLVPYAPAGSTVIVDCEV